MEKDGDIRRLFVVKQSFDVLVPPKDERQFLADCVSSVLCPVSCRWRAGQVRVRGCSDPQPVQGRELLGA